MINLSWRNAVLCQAEAELQQRVGMLMASQAIATGCSVIWLDLAPDQAGLAKHFGQVANNNSRWGDWRQLLLNNSESHSYNPFWGTSPAAIAQRLSQLVKSQLADSTLSLLNNAIQQLVELCLQTGRPVTIASLYEILTQSELTQYDTAFAKWDQQQQTALHGVESWQTVKQALATVLKQINLPQFSPNVPVIQLSNQILKRGHLLYANLAPQDEYSGAETIAELFCHDLCALLRQEVIAERLWPAPCFVFTGVDMIENMAQAKSPLTNTLRLLAEKKVTLAVGSQSTINVPDVNFEASFDILLTNARSRLEGLQLNLQDDLHSSQLIMLRTDQRPAFVTLPALTSPDHIQKVSRPRFDYDKA